MGDLFVVESASAPQLVVFPLPVIGDFVVRVVKHPPSVHFVLLPLSNILAALVIVKDTLSMTHVVEFGAFVPASDVGLRHVLQLAPSLLGLLGLLELDGAAAGWSAPLLFGLVEVEGHGVAVEVAGVVDHRVALVVVCGVVRYAAILDVGYSALLLSLLLLLLLLLLLDLLFGFGLVLLKTHILHLHDIFVFPLSPLFLRVRTPLIHLNFALASRLLGLNAASRLGLILAGVA